MLWIAFELDGPAVPDACQHTATGAATPTRRGIFVGAARNNPFGLQDRSQGLLYRRALATAQRGAGQGESRHFQEVAPTRKLPGGFRRRDRLVSPSDGAVIRRILKHMQ